MISKPDEISTLFEKLTIKEIEDVARKTRAEIEKRKEDLRVMVGERYRDLIEAADTIQDMKTTVESVSNHVSTIYNSSAIIDLSKKGKQNISSSDYSSADRNKNLMYSIAAQVKLLLDIPEKIWMEIEQGNLLRAAHLFLLAQHVHTSLECDASAVEGLSLANNFPIVVRQWRSITHFRATILQHCQQTMKAQGTDNQKIADCLSANMCLTNDSPHKLCGEFFNSRMASIEDSLSPSVQGANVKEQLNCLVSLIKDTICQAFFVFYQLDKKRNSDKKIVVLQEAVWCKYLPVTITEFSPVMETSCALPIGFLKEKCQEWLSKVKETIDASVTRILSYINSVKSLTNIEETVGEVLSQINSDNKWVESSSSLLNRELNIWTEFLGSLFVNRILVILSIQFEDAFVSTKNAILSVTAESNNEKNSIRERDILNYIWLESQNDLPGRDAWESETATENIFSNLTMKSKGYTPRTQSICQNIDANLKAVLDDVHSYVSCCETFARKLSVDCSAELVHIQSEIQVMTNTLIDRLLAFMRNTLNTSEYDYVQLVGLALFFGRICLASTELCPHLQKGVSFRIPVGKENGMERRQSIQGTTLLKFSSPRTADDSKWQFAKAKLIETNLEFLNVWKTSLYADIKIKAEGLVPNHPSEIFKHMPQWETVEIQEESEEGTTVNSSISVPMKATWQLENLLYFACIEINKIGGHLLPRMVLEDIHTELLNCVLTVYNEHVVKLRAQDFPMSQKMCLQLLFDVRFVSGLVSPKGNKVLDDRILTICDDLESFVDPFDLDVFTPHMNDHLKRCIQRSTALFGPVTRSDLSAVSGSSRSATLAHQEQHNILCLSTGSRVRFTLLPLSTTTFGNREEQSAVVREVKSQNSSRKSEKARSSSPHRSSTPPPQGVAKSASASFFGAMSTSWFGN